MAYRVKIVPRAQRDLENIYRYIQARTSEAARAWYVGLRESIRSLRNSPGRCAVTPENDQLRHLLYGHKSHIYRVIYRILERPKHVEVLHIRHGAMDEMDKTEF
jgi:plasmid stabilization system protein ParE